jgi:hypothetical protein
MYEQHFGEESRLQVEKPFSTLLPFLEINDSFQVRVKVLGAGDGLASPRLKPWVFKLDLQ